MILHVFHAVLWATALAALLASAWTDLKIRIIPNELAGLVAICGLCLGLIFRPEQIWISLPAALLVLFGLGVLAHYNLMGGGDVKLISAATLLVPPAHIGQLLLFIALSGGLLSCAYIFARHALKRSGSAASSGSDAEAGGSSDDGEGWFSHECARIAAGGPMPYALAILGGVAATIAGELPQCLLANSCSL